MITVTEKLNITWASMSATVLSSSKYGSEYDRVKILHEIGLQTPLAQDESFYIPPQGKSIDTRVIFPDGNITNFAGQRFKDLQDELSQYEDAVKNQDVAKMQELHQLFLSTAMLTPVVIKAGTAVLTFDYELAIYPKEGSFDFACWAPMPSFAVVPGGQVTAIVQLPSLSGKAFKVSELLTSGLIPDAQGNPTGSEVPKVVDSDFGLRHIVGWNWQNDPLFKVHYKYAD
jgi:hypothetical protein